MKGYTPSLLAQRNLVVYGAGHDAAEILKKLSALALYPAFLVTSQTKAEERIIIDGKKYLLCPSDFVNKNKHFVIVASSKYAKEMVSFLHKKDFSPNIDYIVWKIFDEDSNEQAEKLFVAHSPLPDEELARVYYISCDSLRNVLALTTKNNRDYRIRFCFPDKHNFTFEIPELVYKQGGIPSFAMKTMHLKDNLLNALRTGKNMHVGCQGCTRKRKHIWTDVSKFSVINVGGHPAPCNFKCSYCDARSNRDTVAFSAKLLSLYQETLAELKKHDYIHDKARIMLANGEITVNPAQAGFLSLTDGYQAGILTNGSCFSNLVAKKISDGVSYIQVSIDAGTSETFKKSKGVNLFSTVCKNLKKYHAYGKIVLKYILLPGINDDAKNYDGIISLLRDLELDSLWISTDMFLLQKEGDATAALADPLAKMILYLRSHGIYAYGYNGFLSDRTIQVLGNALQEGKGIGGISACSIVC